MNPRAATLLLACSCSSSPAPGCPSGVLMLCVSPDYSSSGVGVLPLDGTPAPPLLSDSSFQDPVLATSAGRHFVISRTLDTIFEMDSCARGIAEWSARSAGDSCNDTSACNPQDVAVAPDGSLWVARFNVPSLVLLPSDTTVDLSSFDADGNPDMSSVRILGSQAFVALGRLTIQGPNYVSQQPSQVVVLDTSSRAVLATITLAGRNPFGLMMEESGHLWLADLGNISDATETSAGIEVLDTQALTSKLVLTKAALGGSPITVAVQGTCGAAVIADPTPAVNSTSLVSFGSDGSNLQTAMSPTQGFDLRGLLWTPSGRLLVADRRGPPFRVHTFTVGAGCVLVPGQDLTVPSLPALSFSN